MSLMLGGHCRGGNSLAQSNLKDTRELTGVARTREIRRIRAEMYKQRKHKEWGELVEPVCGEPAGRGQMPSASSTPFHRVETKLEEKSPHDEKYPESNEDDYSDQEYTATLPHPGVEEYTISDSDEDDEAEVDTFNDDSKALHPSMPKMELTSDMLLSLSSNLALLTDPGRLPPPEPPNAQFRPPPERLFGDKRLNTLEPTAQGHTQFHSLHPSHPQLPPHPVHGYPFNGHHTGEDSQMAWRDNKEQRRHHPYQFSQRRDNQGDQYQRMHWENNIHSIAQGGRRGDGQTINHGQSQSGYTANRMHPRYDGFPRGQHHSQHQRQQDFPLLPAPPTWGPPPLYNGKHQEPHQRPVWGNMSSRGGKHHACQGVNQYAHDADDWVDVSGRESFSTANQDQY